MVETRARARLTARGSSVGHAEVGHARHAARPPRVLRSKDGAAYWKMKTQPVQPRAFSPRGIERPFEGGPHHLQASTY